MKNKTFRWFYALSMLGVLLASAWPLCMGVRVVRDMVVQGTVMGEDYPKYIIPYLPVALAVILGVVLGALAGGGAVLGVFLYYRKKQHGDSYPLDRYAKLHLTDAQDRFVGSYITRTRVQSNSGGGGGGGSRGGHRGGR